LSLTSDAERELLAYRWPGNVRELRNVIERAAMLTGADFVASRALDLAPRGEPGQAERVGSEVSGADGKGGLVAQAATAGHPAQAAPPGPASEPAQATAPEPAAVLPAAVLSAAAESAAAPESASAAANGTLQQCLDEAARAKIKAALEAAKGNRSLAAKSLDVDATTLGRLIKRLGL